MKVKHFITIICLCISLYAQAQPPPPYVSVKGTFSIAEKRGCAPFSVSISIISPSVCNGANPCVVDFEGNRQFQSVVLTHTYAQAGTFWLSILYQGGNKDSIQVQVFPNIQPAFDIYSCNNNQASIRITDTNYSQYVINYNDGSPTVTVPSGTLARGTHTYTSSGNKTITVRGRNLTALDNCSPANKTFNAIATLPISFINSLTVLDDTQLQLQFTSQPDVQYRLEISINGSPSFQLLQTLYNPTLPLVLTNLKTQQNYYCFRIGTFDPCTNTVLGYSNTICSARFTATAQDGANALAWTTSSTGITDYSIQRDDLAYVLAPSNLTSFNDTDIICKTAYCYQLVHNYTDGSRSYSEKKCATSFSTTPPTPVLDVTATVVKENEVLLQWTNDPAFIPAEYSVTRSSAFLGTTPTPSFTDNLYSTEGAYCYQIHYKDLCDNTSIPSTDVCPIRLTGILSNDNTITLTWTAYTGWQNGVASYQVEKRTLQGALLQAFPPDTNLTLTDNTADLVNQVYVYSVRALPNDLALGQTNSNMVTIIKEPNLYYPTAFTPNGDNLNDTFEVFGQYVLSFEMKVFNRWGELMYTTEDIQGGWDGTFRGVAMPEGTYVFVAEINDLAGRTFNRSGSTLLIRKN